VVFVADDLGAWLVGLLADAGRKKLISVVLGSEQERALRQAANAAVEVTAEEVSLSGNAQAGQVAMVVGEVFREAAPEAPAAGHETLLEVMRAGIARQMSVLDDAGLTGTAQSSAEVLGVPGHVLAEKVTGHLVREIMFRGSRGGTLEPLASQLNHDLTHLQGQRLEGMLAQLVREVQDGLTGREVASKPVRLAPRPALLAGREDLLAGVEARLSRGEAGPQSVALSGLGGAGKTSVAVEYGYRRLAGLGLVWQFTAEDPAAMAAGFVQLAALLCGPGVAGGGDPVVAVHAALATRAGGWLLIFDNAPDAAAVAGVLPPAGDGQVIVTSLSPYWPGDQAVEVPVLDEDTAAGFLMARTGCGDDQAARELARELGGLPLALEQAAAYMLAAGRDIPAYVTLYQGRQVEMLARGDPAGYDKRVATSWSLAFSKLQDHAPAAAGLLRLLACYAPDAIPYRMLLQVHVGYLDYYSPEAGPITAMLLADPLVVDEAIAALRRYSLISAPAGGVVSVHRLVQAITVSQLPDEYATAWRGIAALLVMAALPDDPDQAASWPAYAALLPHAQAALRPGAHPVAMSQAANYLGYSGSYAGAREMFQQIADACRQILGDESVHTLNARSNLAYWTGAAGDPAAARDQFAALLPVRERVSGTEHPITMSDRRNLAQWTGTAGDPAAARDQFAALLPVRERVSGADHPKIIADRAALAYWTGAAGDPAGARDQLAALLPAMRRVLGEEHQETLVAQANLAGWTGEAGDPAGARDQLAALLPVRVRVSGREHPETLAPQANLAYWTGMAGDPARARDQFAALVPIRERVSGAEHPYTLTVRAHLARCTGEAGDTASARDQLAALLPVEVRVFGSEHTETLYTREGLARWTAISEDTL
jgi:hypothetical protein